MKIWPTLAAFTWTRWVICTCAREYCWATSSSSRSSSLWPGTSRPPIQLSSRCWPAARLNWFDVITLIPNPVMSMLATCAILPGKLYDLGFLNSSGRTKCMEYSDYIFRRKQCL